MQVAVLFEKWEAHWEIFLQLDMQLYDATQPDDLQIPLEHAETTVIALGHVALHRCGQ